MGSGAQSASGSRSSDVLDRIVEQNLGAYRAMPSRLQEDVSQEAQVAGDYRGRLIYELLQNADDAMAGDATTEDRVSVMVTDDALWIANTGRPLTDEDVYGLCGLGASSKVDAEGTRRASIGHKGLGFKSVLEITDEPAVYSRTHCFTLGERIARPHVTALWEQEGRGKPRAVPKMRFPGRLDPSDERWQGYEDAGFNTAFCFPFSQGVDRESRTLLANLLLALPLTSVLFLKHLEQVEIRVEQRGSEASETWTVKRSTQTGSDEWRRVTGLHESGVYRISVDSNQTSRRFVVAHDADLEIGQNRAGLSGPAWEGVEWTEVSVATPLPDEPELPAEWRHFHVFLPTEESCPYPILINGAFSTDLSRQRIKVAAEKGDYNAHLVRSAARLIRRQLVPVLLESGATAVLAALDRGEASSGSEQDLPATAADLLHQSICAELAEVPLLPTPGAEELALGEAVLPSVALGDMGADFRLVLTDDAAFAGRRFPSPEFCDPRWIRVAADHGAVTLRGADSVSALGEKLDPGRAISSDDEMLGVEVDPVLELCRRLWEQTSGEERDELVERARTVQIFPVHREDDRQITRVVVGDHPTFYPPRSAKSDLPLQDVHFMAHPFCWGALNKAERLATLGDRLTAWTALFDVGEFRFETVVQSAVTPPLALDPKPEALARRDALRDTRTLAALCQLSGAHPKPDRPLRYQRLHSDRALFPLSRLEVPCRTNGGDMMWEPAYKVYFGADWIGDASVEAIDEEVESLDGDSPKFVYLAPPEELVGLLDDLDEQLESMEAVDDSDEVDEDEDADAAIETSAIDRWVAFLSWIGVNSSLRLIHFHDVGEERKGWLSTKGLTQPTGWAFEELGSTWESYAAQLCDQLDGDVDLEGIDPYFYELLDLDQIVVLLEAAREDPSAGIARALTRHVIQHWPWYSRFARATLALVEKGKSPGQRSKPPRALTEELTEAGDNLWLHRLKNGSVCPTAQGPRRPEVCWLPSAELDRRFGRRGRQSAELLPVLDVDGSMRESDVRALAESLGIRREPNPSSFTLEDARRLCKRLEEMYGSEGGIGPNELREVVKPVYREMFELLSGRAGVATQPVLVDAPLLAETPDGYGFLPAAEVLFAGTPGLRERSGVSGSVPIFVLEAEPAATAPLTRLFGVRRLEDALEWEPDPGAPALEGEALEEFRVELRKLTIPIGARVRAERSRPGDLKVLQEFIERVEPVESLGLRCRLEGVELEVEARPYFVAETGSQGSLPVFVVWEGARAWPPPPESRQGLAMALADALGINLVETFLAFIEYDGQQRQRLLDIAGATGFLAEVEAELAGGTADETQDGHDRPDVEPTPDDSTPSDEKQATPPDPVRPAAPPVPLLEFEHLTIDGFPITVVGDRGDGGSDSGDGDGSGSGSNGKGGHRGAAPGLDLHALDRLGMQIAMGYEIHRLRRAGHDGATDALSGTGAAVVVDVHSPTAIREAEDSSAAAAAALKALEQSGISRVHPGFDILTVVDSAPDRLIELKSSGVDARVQEMSWNEWKTAKAHAMRPLFWLYLVGNLRADLPKATPCVRAIRDPFGTLAAQEVEREELRRAVQLRVREFKEAEHLDLGVEGDEDAGLIGR